MEKPFAAYDGPGPYVFACYAHADAATVYPDLVWLRESGFNVWYDEGIPAGSTWRDEVALAISQAALIVYFASPASAASSHCQQELSFALSRERGVLRIDLVPTQLTPGLDLALSSSQALHRYDMSEARYRDKFNASLRRIDALSAQRTLPIPASPAPDSAHSIAILPLANRSRDPDNEYLCDGITEELIAGLSQLDGLKVKSFLAVAHYRGRQLAAPEIGRELGVKSIVAGSLQRSGDRIRVNVGLTRSHDGEILWSRHYDNEMHDIFALQDDVARQVVEALGSQLRTTHAGPIVDAGTTNVQAYQAYLLGRHELSKNTLLGLAAAATHFKHAVELDPEWVDAWGELAETFWEQDLYALAGGDDHAIANLREAAARLAELDPTKTNRRWYRIDERLAASAGVPYAHVRAVVVNADRYASSYVAAAYARLTSECRVTGLYECGLQITQVWTDRYPSADSAYQVAYQRAVLLAGLRRFDLAIDACSQALEENPGEGWARGSRCSWLARTGQYARAAVELDILGGMWGPHHFSAFNYHFWRGDLDAARTCLIGMESRQDYSASFIGIAAWMLGDRTRAFDHFESATKERWLGRTLRCLADTYLTDKLRTELEAEPNWQRVLAPVYADDDSRRRLMGVINELTPQTGVTLDADGIPQQVTA